MLPRDDLAAALAARRELGPDYDAAFLEKVVDRLDSSIEARVDARLGRYPVQESPQAKKDRSSRAPIAIVSLLVSIPLSAIAAVNAKGAGLAIVWLALVVINVGYAVTSRRR